jgi:molecular chaperone GrpE
MTTKKTVTSASQPDSEPQPAAAASSPTDGADPDANAPAAEADASETLTIPVAEYEQLRREVVEWKERCMRTQAEFENVRKRLRKEADEAGTRAVARFAKPILGEIDNLERAIAAAKSESFAEFAQGVSMIQENFRTALAGLGIESVPCEGIFDPAVHEVLAEEEDATLPRGQIIKVHRRGYRLKNQLVRAAQVVVARPPAPPTDATGPKES